MLIQRVILISLVASVLAGCAAPRELTRQQVAPQLRVAGGVAADRVKLRAASDPDLKQYVLDNVATARTHLASDEAIATLKGYSKSLDAAKWINVILSAGTTTVGTIGSNAATKSNGYTIGTAIIGGISTVAVAIRDDKTIAARIAVCETDVQSGNKAIDKYSALWSAKITTAPAAGTPQRDQFVNDLADATASMFELIDGMMTTCR